MLTCKDCLHYDACHFHIDEETSLSVSECSTGFKHKDQYIKLPAYIGQEVWLIGPVYEYIDMQYKTVGYKVESGRVSMLQQKVDKSWKIRITTQYVSDYTLDEFMERVFTSEADAVSECERRVSELKWQKYYLKNCSI